MNVKRSAIVLSSLVLVFALLFAFARVENKARQIRLIVRGDDMGFCHPTPHMGFLSISPSVAALAFRLVRAPGISGPKMTRSIATT